jgi:hypothetical protein
MLRTLLLGVIALTLAAPLPGFQKKPPPPKKPAVNPDAAVIADFVKRVDGYAALHKKLEGTLPTLPKQTTPQQMDAHERALAKLIQDGRASAKQGDLFTPSMQRLVRRLLAPVFTGRAGAQIKAEITDKEYKGTVKLAVNGRYPDEVPVSTMPPQVLQALPKLPEELEYRFVLTSLILFDPHAHIIPDFVEHAFK